MTDRWQCCLPMHFDSIWGCLINHLSIKLGYGMHYAFKFNRDKMLTYLRIQKYI